MSAPRVPRTLRLARLGAALALAATCVAGAARAAETAPGFDQAMQAYERNHWPEAYAAFARLADQGHPEAARLALQMWAWGPRLYGRRFDASEQQLRQWRQQRREFAGAEALR